MNAGAVLTVVSLAAMLLAGRLGVRGVEWVAKPLAASGFLVSAVQHGALESRYGLAVLAGLACSWCGDVALLSRERRWFLTGLVAFLLGHVAYCVAFGLRGLDLRAVALAAAVIAPCLALVARWLLPHVKGAMRAPVLAYMGVISVMVALAAGTVAARGNPLVLVGAVAFYLSDLSVARDRFVAPGLVNKLWGAPLYFGAQLVLAATTATP